MKNSFLLLISCIPLLLNSLEIDPITAKSAILINAKTGQILYQKNPLEERSPASILKIATCAYALKEKKHELHVEIETPQDCIGAVSEKDKEKSKYSQPAHWLVFDACHMGIKKGEIMTLGDLIHGMMIASADDASNVIAYYIGKESIPQFMEKLNEWVKELGCEHTHFVNPHGLFHPKQHTCAFDMALIAREAVKEPLLREIAKKTSFERPKTNRQETTTLAQTNRLLRKGKWHYRYATGLKTGSIKDAGYCLIASAEKEDRSLISVLMGCKEKDDVYKETIALFEAAFNEEKVEEILIPAGPQEFHLEIPKYGSIPTYLHEPLKITSYPSEESNVQIELLQHETTPPLVYGEKIATLRAKDEKGLIVASVPLLVDTLPEKSSLDKFKNAPFSWKLVGGIILLLFLFGIAWRLTGPK